MARVCPLAQTEFKTLVPTGRPGLETLTYIAAEAVSSDGEEVNCQNSGFQNHREALLPILAKYPGWRID